METHLIMMNMSCTD